MSTASPPDAFRLGRLRLARLPPARLHLTPASRRPQTLPVELAAAVTDDYGVDLEFDELHITIDLLEAGTLEPPSGITLSLDGSLPTSSRAPSTSATFAFQPARGPFHTLKAALTFPPSASARPVPPLCFRLSVSPSPSSSALAVDSSPYAATSVIRTIIGESTQSPTETWDGQSYVFLGVTSGQVAVELGKGGKGSQDKGAPTFSLSCLRRHGRTRRRTCSALRSIEIVAQKLTAHGPPLVQSALRIVNLSPPASDSSAPPPPFTPTPITVLERPGLNNSTGQRLWDCAIGLSAYLTLHPPALDASTPLANLPPFSDEPSRPSKKPRLEPAEPSTKRRRLRVVELGAGCALASLAAAHVLRSMDGIDASVLATDIEATVETTLRENLDLNARRRRGAVEVRAGVLDWGQLAPAQVDEVVDGAQSVTLVGTDILYNPSSHGVLLSTLLSVLRPPSPSTNSSPASPAAPAPPHRRAIIAYKRRTDGDDAFFSLARDGGLDVRQVWAWGEVGVWAFE
ncbi:hypothetical protein JCM9279_003944 [Rhodotorula babjevae]